MTGIKVLRCNENFLCITAISKHADSVNHKNNIKTNSLFNSLSNNNLPIKRVRKFKQSWLDIEEFKDWLREKVMENNLSVPYCIVCNMSIAGDVSHIYSHAKSKAHIDRYNNFNEISQRNEISNEQHDESLLSFEERRKEAEIRYAALIADKNISFQTANEILNFFQHVGKDPNVLKSMNMGRTKCKNIITNVLCPIETERVINKIQNTKFTIFIDETSDICNKKMDDFSC